MDNLNGMQFDQNFGFDAPPLPSDEDYTPKGNLEVAKQFSNNLYA